MSSFEIGQSQVTAAHVCYRMREYLQKYQKYYPAQIIMVIVIIMAIEYQVPRSSAFELNSKCRSANIREE